MKSKNILLDNYIRREGRGETMAQVSYYLRAVKVITAFRWATIICIILWVMSMVLYVVFLNPGEESLRAKILETILSPTLVGSVVGTIGFSPTIIWRARLKNAPGRPVGSDYRRDARKYRKLFGRRLPRCRTEKHLLAEAWRADKVMTKQAKMVISLQEENRDSEGAKRKFNLMFNHAKKVFGTDHVQKYGWYYEERDLKSSMHAVGEFCSAT